MSSDKIFMLYTKANQTAKAIKDMGNDQRADRPSETFLGDYNKLRVQAIEAKPVIKDIVPPEATGDESLGEMMAFYAQLTGLLT